MGMWTRNVLLGCQIGKQFQSRQWWNCKSYVSNFCHLSYMPQGRPRHTWTVMRNAGYVERHKKVSKNVVSGCSALVQTLYLARHNAALKILFFEMLRGYQLADAMPPWYSPVQPKPVYQDDKVAVYWDVPVFTEHL